MSEVKEKVSPISQPAVPATSTTESKKKVPGLTFRRFFTKVGVNPYDEVEWEKRTAAITDAQGNIIFEQKDVEVPKDWSMTATNIVASKYLHGQVGTPARETGARQLVSRVAETIRDWGMAQGYFRSAEDGATFHSIRPSGSTWAATASSPTRTPLTGTGIPLSAVSSSASRDTKRRSVPPASSTPFTTRSIPFSLSPKLKACSSSGARGPAPISLPCALRLSN
jgi:hypothetical protein